MVTVPVTVLIEFDAVSVAVGEPNELDLLDRPDLNNGDVPS